MPALHKTWLDVQKLTLPELHRLAELLADLIEVREAETAAAVRERGADVIEVRPGRGMTLVRQLIRCGKPRCRCSRGGKPHGPYWYGFTHRGGRVVSVYIGKQLAEET